MIIQAGSGTDSQRLRFCYNRLTEVYSSSEGAALGTVYLLLHEKSACCFLEEALLLVSSMSMQHFTELYQTLFSRTPRTAPVTQGVAFATKS